MCTDDVKGDTVHFTHIHNLIDVGSIKEVTGVKEIPLKQGWLVVLSGNE